MNLLLLSSSRVGTTGYLEHAESMIKNHLGSTIKSILFIPYAGVTISFDDYEKMAASAFAQFGYQLRSIHHSPDPVTALEKAEAIAVGGGNTFHLLNSLYQHQLLQTIREKVSQGIPYIGWSAGSNIAAPTICTTNDMPIIEPPSFKSLGLLPFQINPHYIDGNPPGHNGETREQRLDEFLAINSNQKVIGIPEGTALRYQNDSLRLLGDRSAYLFTHGQQKQTIAAESDLSYLL